jgi:hypothetical protein
VRLLPSMKIWLSCDGTLDRRAIKMNLANEGFEARKKEEEVTAKKRKAEDDARWEGTILLPFVWVFLAILMPTPQKPGNSAWTVGVPSPIHRKRRKSRRATFLAEVLSRSGVRAVSVPVHIAHW